MLMIVSREIEMLGKDGGFGGQRCHLRTNLLKDVTNCTPAAGHVEGGFSIFLVTFVF